MFIKSNMSREVRYNKSSGSIVLKPNTVTYVDENLVTAKELKDCYGDRINIMSRETVEKFIVETAPKNVDDIIEGVKTDAETTEPKLDSVDIKFSDGTEEVDSTDDKSDKSEADEIEGATDEATSNEDLTSNTGDEAIDDFLNGKTDKVPEGTQEITEEEALKLKEKAEEEKVKEPAKKPAKKVAGKKVVKASTKKK